MATLLKAPTSGSRGVVVFTTQERDRLINPDAGIRSTVQRLKPRWAVGLHHNWHDWDFEYDELFDFSLAGEGDLRERSGRHVPLIPMDACNFVPREFRPGSPERFWDILYVARAVSFKGIPEFLRTIRALYDAGHRLRVLCISPMPPYDPADSATTFYELRERYEEMFSNDEQAMFTLLDPSFRYPFPFDLETLAFFYRSSRVFVHFTEAERRCRVAAYAWVSGLPVVAMEPVASLLPPLLRREPYYFRVDDYDQFPDRILAALRAAEAHDGFDDLVDEFSSSATTTRFARLLAESLGEAATGPEDYALDNLGIRLGRHHGLSMGPNRVEQRLADLVQLMREDEDAVREALADDDPELFLASRENARRPGGRVQAWLRRGAA